MEERILEDLRHIESDTRYVANKKVYDIYPEDCLEVESRLYACFGESHAKFGPMKIACLLKGKKNVVLDFQGATILLHGRLQAFVLDSCENVCIENVNIKAARPFTTEFEVIKSDAHCMRLRPLPGFDVEIEDEKIIPVGENYRNDYLDKAPVFLQAFNPDRTGDGLTLAIFGAHPDPDPTLPWLVYTQRLRCRFDGDDLLLEGDNVAVFKEGNRAIIGHEDRTYSTIYLVDCRSITLRSFRILTGPGMGVGAFHTGNLTLDRLLLTYDETSPGFSTNAADGIHATACYGSFRMQDCVIEGTIDDALNIHSNFWRVVAAEGNSLISKSRGSVAKEYRIYEPGDVIAVYRGSTMEKKGEATILAIEPHEAGKRFTLDREIEGVEPGDLIENVSCQPHVTMERCRFGKANTHLRLQTRGGIEIRDSYTELPFLLTGDTNYWYESSPVDHILVENVTFAGYRANILVIPEFDESEKEPHYHGELEVRHCSFEPKTVVSARQIRRVVFEDNVSSSNQEMVVELDRVGEAKIQGANIQRKA